ncbi:septum formation initiator [Catenuloplanes sp. NPDC051500]|uniref:septum formation initiator n=1 Tax=Catenuloplanes sp. NPDC051500 TaxID=3363959 RepID=UPI00378A5CBA
MSRRTEIAVAGWLAAAVVATLIGLAAIRLIGESIVGTPDGVLSEQEVAAAVATLPSPSDAPTTSAPSTSASSTSAPSSPALSSSPSAATSPAALGGERAFAVTGGTAVASCADGDRARLVTWAPAQGWTVAEVERGPARDVKVEFAGPGGESELRVRCRGGVAVQHESGGD